MEKLARTVLLILVLSLILPLPSQAQQGTIEEIRVLGLYRMTREAFLHALGLKVGDPYDERQIRARYKALWDLALFEDIVVDRETGPKGGAVLVIKIKERPVLTTVTYEDNKVANRTAIEDRLKEQKIGLQLGKPIDPGAIFRAETAIRNLLGEKGFLNAEVEAVTTVVTETTRAVHFKITPGGKTRIRDIRFTGNTVFSDGKLKGTLELTQERKWYWPWSSKNLYHPVKWDQDVSKISKLYQDRGYLDVEVRPPVLEVREVKPREGKPAKKGDDAELAPKKLKKREKQQRKRQQKSKAVKRWVELTVPIVEGPQYDLGEITISGNEVIPEELLRAMIPLQSGAILRFGLLEAAMEGIQRLYEDRGHLYATVVRHVSRREGENVADVELIIEEDEPYYISTIEFTGNSKTHDKVLRREMILAEGELFSRSKLDISKMKINQLGYFQVEDDPVIEPVEGENRVSITFPGLEQSRNEIQIGGGYSGYEGAFFNGVYSTRNFLGRGQIFQAALQIGGRSDRYQLSITEPWFLNRPYRLGFNVFRRDLDYGASLRSSSRGRGIVLGKLIGRFTRVDISYNWEKVSQRTFLGSDVDSDDIPDTVSDELSISSITPVYYFSTVNNPYRPTRGKSFHASLQLAGGPLGGQVSFWKPVVSFTAYKRAFRGTYLGFNARVGMVREWQETEARSNSIIMGIPRYQRFWLGGDTLGPRGFDTRTITPLRYVTLDEFGNIDEVLGDPRKHPADDFVSTGGIPIPIEVGGDRFFLFQSEYVWPLNEQAELALFVDIGDALFEDQPWGFSTVRVSAGVEARFHLPIFPVPLRLIFGYPVRKLEGDQTSSFTFSIGRSF